MKSSPFLFPKTVRFLLLSSILLLGGAVGRAAVALMPPSFPDANWSLRPYTNKGTGPEQVSMHGYDWVRFNRTSSVDNSGQLIYNAGFYNGNFPVKNPANQLGDIAGSVILASSRWDAKSAMGLTLRGFNTNSTTASAYNNPNAYYLAVTKEGLNLYWGVGDEFIDINNQEFRLALGAVVSGQSIDVFNAENNHQYLLEFSFIGNHLTASLWKLDSEGDKGAAVASLDYIDSRPEYSAEGYFGVRSSRFPGNANGYFRDLQVQVIPEPSTVGLVLMSIAAGVVFVALRRKS